MKIKTKLIVGLSTLIIIFSFNMLIDRGLDAELQKVADYHNFMSIPALTTLEKISNTFSEMDGKIYHDIALDDFSSDLTSYLESYNELNSQIEEYGQLAFGTYDNGDFFANEMMRMQMQQYVQQMNVIKEEYNENALSVLSSSNLDSAQTQIAFENLDANRALFSLVLDEAKLMETQGKISAQKNLESITSASETFNNASLILSILFSVVIAFWIIRSVEIPIKKIQKTTTEIAKGNFGHQIEVPTDDEYYEVSKNINKMSSELVNKTTKIRKQERLSAIGELAARVSHDIRNPLGAIKMATELLQKEILPKNPSTQEKFRIIDRSISRMSHQVENVLDFLREKTLKLDSCNISDVVKQSFANLSTPKDVKIKFELSNTNLVCDIHMIETVITNLLVNAIQAISEKGEIIVRTRSESDSVIIEIQDSGAGVPSEDQAKIFEPLFTTKQRGTGLGLASCKKIVDSHKGAITYKNNPSTFIVTLPILANPLAKKQSK